MLCLQQLFDGTYLITCLIYNKFMLHFTGCFLVGFHCNTSLFSSLYFKFVVIATALMAIDIDVAPVAIETDVVVVVVAIVAEIGAVVVVEAVVGIVRNATLLFSLFKRYFKLIGSIILPNRRRFLLTGYPVDNIDDCVVLSEA